MTIRATATVHVDACVERAFQVLTDPARFHEWQAGMEPARVADAAAPVGMGSRLASGRTIAGMRVGFTSEVTEWDPPRRMAFVGVRTLLAVRGAFAVDPEDGGARITATLQVDVPRLAPVRLGNRAAEVIADQLADDLRRLAVLVEADAPAGRPGDGTQQHPPDR